MNCLARHAIRKGKTAASADNVTETHRLQIGSIEDFGSDFTPEPAVYLSERMPACDFLCQTATSYDLIGMLRDGH